NFEDVSRDLRLPLPPGRWHVFELWEERYRGLLEGEAEFALVAPHSSRVVAMRPDLGRPQVVGTTAHIGIGALDFGGQRFDAGTGVLRVDVTAAGRRSRRLYIASA